MRISGPITVSALVVAGLVASGSAAHTTADRPSSSSDDARLAAASTPAASSGSGAEPVGFVPAAPEPPRKLRAMTPSNPDVPLFSGTVPLQDISLPATG
ncbi:MAG: lytic transglycosylase, partial [Nocardia sp.]|nr:lytic transglycosylase [Nocardia sp.]